MAKKYLTLEEAAQQLSLPKDELIRMRENGDIRGFADRGNWKFKVEDVQTLVRRRQADSDPETPMLPRGDSGVRKADLGSSDSDVRLVTDSGIISGSGSKPSGGADQDSDSDIRLSAGTADSDSDVKLVDPSLEEDSDSDVKLVGDDSDSDVKIMPDSASDSDITLASDSAKSDSDSDVKLVGDDTGSDITLAGPHEKTDSDIRLAGSDSDVRLVPDDAARGSNSDVQVIDASNADEHASDSDIALVRPGDSAVAVDFGTDDESALSDESGIALAGGSSMSLASESGISLERPLDSGISLDLDDDEGITLAEDSGIALESPSDSGIALSPIKGDDLGHTAPMMDAVRGREESGTKFDIPSMTEDESGEFRFDDGIDEDTGIFDLEGDQSDDQTALVDAFEDSGDLGDAVFDVDEDDSGELSDELEFDDDFGGGSAEDLDVFEAEGADYEEGFTSGVSHSEFRAPVSRAATVEADWGTGPFVSLLLSTVLLVVTGFVMFDLVRSMWMWNEPTSISSMFLNLFGGLYGS